MLTQKQWAQIAKDVGIKIPKGREVCVLIPEGKHIWGDSGPWAFHRVFDLDDVKPIIEHFNLSCEIFKTRAGNLDVVVAGHLESHLSSFFAERLGVFES